jgi:hypothetical protein
VVTGATRIRTAEHSRSDIHDSCRDAAVLGESDAVVCTDGTAEPLNPPSREVVPRAADSVQSAACSGGGRKWRIRPDRARESAGLNIDVSACACVLVAIAGQPQAASSPQ